MKVTIVGAGVVGCAIAHELASRGARVRLVDPRGAGLGATRASAGILAPYIEGHLAPLLTLGVRSLAMYDEFLRRVTADSGEHIEYERNGTLQVGRTAAEAADLCAAARLLVAARVDHALLDAGETRQFEPALAADVAGSLHVRDHAYVAAGALTRALAAAAARHGAEIIAARVTSVDGGDVPRVGTPEGPLEADAVIVAAGSWSTKIAYAGSASLDPAYAVGEDPAYAVGQDVGLSGGVGRVPRSGPGVDAVKPIRGQLLQLRLESRPASRVIWGSRCYIVPWRDGRVLVGATVEDVGFDETTTAAGVRDLLDASAELMPALRGAALEDARAGLRPMTRDELPAIGPSTTMRNVFYATGHYRNGVLLAPVTAALVADLVLDGGRSPELALVRPDRLGL